MGAFSITSGARWDVCFVFHCRNFFRKIRCISTWKKRWGLYMFPPQELFEERFIEGTISPTSDAFSPENLLVEIKCYYGNLVRKYPERVSNRGTFSGMSCSRNISRNFNRHFQWRKLHCQNLFKNCVCTKKNVSGTFLAEGCFTRGASARTLSVVWLQEIV